MNNTSFKKPKLRFASSAFQPFIYIDGAVDGNFNTNTDQKIKVRLENYGNLHSFQETDLRILVASSTVISFKSATSISPSPSLS